MASIADLLARSACLSGDEARRDAEILLCAALGKNRGHLFAWPEREVSPRAAERYLAWLEARRAGTPLAYILGEREFWSLDLQVDASTLIPRPETELLVERALHRLPPGGARALDLGTGSGAIALALASERPDAGITATDISAAALARARANGEKLGLHRVRWLEGRWFSPLDAKDSFALIVSNPPYLAADDPHLREGDLPHEPRSALVAGDSGLEAIEHIVEHAPRFLEPGGWLLLEHGCEQGAAVQALLRSRGFQAVSLYRDLAGLDRVCEARWSAPGA